MEKEEAQRAGSEKFRRRCACSFCRQLRNSRIAAL